MNIQGFNPAIVSPIQGQSASSILRAQSLSNSTGSDSMSPSNLEGTFLNLLVTELQNQDPTSPVEPTQMVSQMVSLNQLDQLISINEVLKNMAADATSAASAQGRPVKAGAANSPRTTIGSVPASIAQSSMAVLPQPVQYSGIGSNEGLMNLYGNIALPGTTSHPILMGAK